MTQQFVRQALSEQILIIPHDLRATGSSRKYNFQTIFKNESVLRLLMREPALHCELTVRSARFQTERLSAIRPAYRSTVGRSVLEKLLF